MTSNIFRKDDTKDVTPLRQEKQKSSAAWMQGLFFIVQFDALRKLLEAIGVDADLCGGLALLGAMLICRAQRHRL
jgi:hypothetical protein